MSYSFHFKIAKVKNLGSMKQEEDSQISESNIKENNIYNSMKIINSEEYAQNELKDTGLYSDFIMIPSPSLIEYSEVPEFEFTINPAPTPKLEEVEFHSNKGRWRSWVYKPGPNAGRADVVNKTIIRVIKRFYTELFVNGASKIHYLSNPIAKTGLERIDEVSMKYSIKLLYKSFGCNNAL